MGKKGSSKKGPAANSGPQMSLTMREAATGKKHTNVKSSLKLQHIKNLAVWASHDAAIPSLGAFFGHHFAASSEALGSPVDPSLFTCQRCESILHPGYNCTIRIEKNKKKSRHKGKKTTNYPRNNIVYTCNFCSHRNMKRGTPKNTSQLTVKAHPKPTNNAVYSSKAKAPEYKDNVITNVIAAPLRSTPDDPNRGRFGVLEVCETLNVKRNSADMNSIATPVESTADDPRGNIGVVEIAESLEVKTDSASSAPNAANLGSGKMGILEVSERVEVKDDYADMNTIADPLGFTTDDPRGNIGIVEINDTLKVENDSVTSGSNADNPGRGQMEILEISETLKVKDAIASPLESTAEDDPRGHVGIGIVDINETLEVRTDSADINTSADDHRGNISMLEITETLEVKNESNASCPATPLTKPGLTLLEAMMKKRNRSGAKKTPASKVTTEALDTNTSNRRRRKSWTSLKEIAQSNNKSKRF